MSDIDHSMAFLLTAAVTALLAENIGGGRMQQNADMKKKVLDGLLEGAAAMEARDPDTDLIQLDLLMAVAGGVYIMLQIMLETLDDPALNRALDYLKQTTTAFSKIYPHRPAPTERAPK